MKRLVLFAAHFPPSNLAAVHRARLWAQHLPEFGYEPIVVTTHHDHYEEALDWELHALVPPELRVVRTRAFPTRPLRVVGDIGVRGFPWHYRALADLARRGEMDFLHVTIPSNHSALLGPLLRRRYGTPYGIDYIDPWVHAWPGSDVPWTKAWTAARLARVLEPCAVRDASLITGVAPLYYEEVLRRHPDLASRVVTAAMPYGGSERDFDAVRGAGRRPHLFDPSDGNFHVVYAGAMLPRAYPVLERLLDAVESLQRGEPDLARRLRLHFVGTGRSPDDPDGHTVRPHAVQRGLSDLVHEHPRRIPYGDVLNHLAYASGILILGSTEPHYTPSKAFQAVLARRPVFALLHERSTATALLRDARAARVVSFGEALPASDVLAEELARFMRDGYDPKLVRWDFVDRHSARQSAHALAEAVTEALARDVLRTPR
jgi:hypothetical protein